ncbi:alpha/beta hydrolase [Streptacidiphilus sp. N1-10]|uniref:Alpha/beta hydrolase n=1 Tax=Streptacidiphilus jeojiensis TaxID=3229225 RepID=A0ABV6XXM2_9ACTN
MTTQDIAPLTTGTHSIEVDGIVQRYHVHGQGPVCVAHSGGPGIAWEYLRMPELERRLTVVYLEPIGTGASGRLAAHPAGYTRARYSRCLDAVIEHLGVGRVHLLGHSHGGFVAQYLALRHPEQVASVILYESAPVTGDEHVAEAMARFQEFAARNADRPELPEVVAALQSLPAATGDDEITRVVRGVIPAYFADFWGREQEFSAFRSAAAAAFIRAEDDHRVPDTVDDRGALGGLGAPALVLVGRQDFICGVRWAEELHALIPGSELVVFEDSGHFAHIEEPERFAEVVAGFVAARTADAGPAPVEG